MEGERRGDMPGQNGREIRRGDKAGSGDRRGVS